MDEIDFLRLTTDICYIISGFFGGTGTEENVFPFMQDYTGDTVWLDMNQKMVFASDEFTRLQLFALEKVAKDHGLGFDIFSEEEAY